MAKSAAEEIANTLSHGAGIALGAAATPLLVVGAVEKGGPGNVVGAAVFGASLILLYLASTVYHAFPPGKGKEILRRMDHSAIFLLIAGTYTPFTLGVLGGAWGWSLFGVVWGLAAVGIFLKVFGGVRYKRASTAMYVAMGWMVLIAVRPLWAGVEPLGLVFLLAGGFAYTLGVPFYLARGLRYSHFVWHLFVLAGSICHFFAVLGYAA